MILCGNSRRGPTFENVFLTAHIALFPQKMSSTVISEGNFSPYQITVEAGNGFENMLEKNLKSEIPSDFVGCFQQGADF